MRVRLGALIPLLCSLAACSGPEEVAARRVEAPAEARALPEPTRRSLEADGITLALELEPLARSVDSDAPLAEGDVVRVSLDIRSGSNPVTGLDPGAWMDLAPAGGAHADEQGCVSKVQTLLGGSLFSRAEIDLNTYYVLALNDDATVTVTDPLFGFGGSRLLELVELPGVGYDWALSPDQERLLVTVPDQGVVVVVDTRTWRILRKTALPSAGRIAFQPDGGYAWVSWQTRAGAGVAALSPEGSVVAQVETGGGPQEIASSRDSSAILVTNAGSGTVSVLRSARPNEVLSIPTSPEPVSVAWSDASHAWYVGHRGGEIVVIDGEALTIRARVETAPGLNRLRASLDGRFVFLLGGASRHLQVLDTATDRVVAEGDLWGVPLDVTFTETLAYLRLLDDASVLMVPLDALGEDGGRLQFADFPGGNLPPSKATLLSPASPIVRAPGAPAVLVTNPADREIYFYKEGMAAPMGSFPNTKRQGRALEVVDRSLRERAPGHFETVTTLLKPGSYDLAVFLEAPRTVRCFALDVAPDPARARLAAELPLVSLAGGGRELQVGSQAKVALEMRDGEGQPISGVEDLVVRALLPPGRWHHAETARPLADGRYEVEFELPQRGVYALQVSVPSRGLAMTGTPIGWLEVTAPAAEEVK